MSSSHELILDFHELRYLMITCSGCGMRIILDASRDNLCIPATCGSCQSIFNVAFKRRIEEYCRLYKLLCDSSEKVQFRVSISQTLVPVGETANR